MKLANALNKNAIRTNSMTLSATLNKTNGKSRIAAAVNRYSVTRRDGPNNACNAEIIDQSRSTAMAAAEMWDSANTPRRVALTSSSSQLVCSNSNDRLCKVLRLQQLK